MFDITYMSISTKLSLTVSLLIIFLLTVFSGILLYRENNIMEENLQSKGQTITQNVAMSCGTALMGNDFAFLRRVVSELIKDQDIVYALVLNKENEIIAWSPENVDKEQDVAALYANIAAATSTPFMRFYCQLFQAEVYDIADPIRVGGETWGMVRLGISLESMKQKYRSNIIIVALLLIVTVGIGIIAVFQLGRRISKPIQELVKSTSVIAQGILNEPVIVYSNDEVGILAHSFEKMRLSLKTQIAEIARKALGLEGDLKVFSLPDLIQMVCSNKQTGILHLIKEDDWGKIYIKNGEILLVENSWNEDFQSAFFRFFNWSAGEFNFDRVAVEVEQDVNMSWEHLLMEGARHTDELERIKKAIPSEDVKVAIVSNPPENVKKIKLTIEELQFTSLVQEPKSVSEILEDSPFDEFHSFKLLYSLLSAGLIYVVSADDTNSLSED
ncbi:DUF4388 domain-containing protein [candidate division CSSED10-310 bacterium]|uniref:DUF4388 domain-containing protein n=1 Tax=candidate division CSSED10-310 bacterium TaxID=2855610 RepID=A0ABV6YWV8_UNCC1